MTRSRHFLAAAIACLTLFSAAPAHAEGSDSRTTVQHNITGSIYFADDICGPRSGFATYTVTVTQQQFVELADGSWSYRTVELISYSGDYDDPALPDVTGRLTAVYKYNLTPGDTFIASEPFHEFFGDVKIWWKYHLTIVDGEPVVERFVVDWTGCP